jgi:protocatechuate 3,4-dioxygenase beta subunit
MKASILPLLILLISVQTFGQTDTAKLMTEVDNKLKSHSSTVSGILTDPTYDLLHPKTAFRELVKKYADTKTIVIANEREPGKKIIVTTTLKNKNGEPIADASVYLYQTDAKGWYAADAPHVLAYEGDHRHARLFGYTKTGKNGQLELHTVKPSGYPKSDLPAHIHVLVTAEGYQTYGTEFLFDDDERLVGNIREQSVRNQFIIAKPEKAAAPFQQKFSYTLILKKK